jgi:hypothetical protein
MPTLSEIIALANRLRRNQRDRDRVILINRFYFF